jgi:hypothetical protein
LFMTSRVYAQKIYCLHLTYVVEYMQMAIIDPRPKSLKELILDKYYHIPLYQRPYDWDIDKVSELWDDIDKNDPGYFLGFLLFKPEPPNDPHPVQFEIVDGQQRLATLLLLLRAAIETLGKTNAKSEASEFQRDYIAQRPAGVKKSRLTLILSKRDKDKFESLLLGQKTPTTRKLSSWNNLDDAIIFFREKFVRLNREKGTQGIINFINNKILKLSFLEVLLGSDSDVYQFFETLNDRGMDLSIADLVKNRVCGEAAKQSISVDECASTIDRISDELSSGKFKTFLLHYCWANTKGDEPTPRKKLMDWYIKRIGQKGDVKEFLTHLEKYSLQYYVNFVDPSKCNDSDKKDVFTYLDALGATRCYPLLLKAEDSLTKKQFLKLCNAIEILTFRHSTIFKRDSKILEGVYNGLIKDINNKKPFNELLKVLKKQDAIKSDKQFELDFAEFATPNHKVARYTLLKIEEYLSGKEQAHLDWDRLTLEHILSQKLAWPGRDEYLERLGNLTLLSLKMNQGASNNSYSQKRQKIYKKEKRVKITKDLIRIQSFTKSRIISRQKEFAKLAIKIWSADNIL